MELDGGGQKGGLPSVPLVASLVALGHHVNVNERNRRTSCMGVHFLFLTLSCQGEQCLHVSSSGSLVGGGWCSAKVVRGQNFKKRRVGKFVLQNHSDLNYVMEIPALVEQNERSDCVGSKKEKRTLLSTSSSS